MENRQIKNHYGLIVFWKKDFTKRIKAELGSQLKHFDKALELSEGTDMRTDFDKVMIEYLIYIDSNPLDKNHYFKYFNSYIKGKKLKEKFFKHDLNALKEYYKSYDSKTKEEKDRQASKFSVPAWERYVLFMMLKFKGVYNKNDNGLKLDLDEIFNVKIIGSREYNPLTNVSRVLRGELPASLNLIEYDISRANPTFIDIEVGIERKTDIYSIIGKTEYNSLINSHKESSITISKLRKKLKPLYGEKVNKVITEKRYNEKGLMYKNLTAYEKEYIQKFVKHNGLTHYVRLHDAVFVSKHEEIIEVNFGKVKFKKTPLQPPQVLNKKKLFYNFIGSDLFTSAVSYKEFLEQENFIRVTEANNDTITIFKDSNNVVKPFNHLTDTVAYLKSQINEYNTFEVENKLAKDNNTNIKNSFLLMQPKPLKYYRDGEHSFGLPFKNGFCRFNKDISNIEIIPYKEVKGFFPEHNTQKRVFNPTKDNAEMSEFQRFLTMVSVGKDPEKDTLDKEEQKIFDSFCNMFGYLCHTYKNPSFAKAIVLTDHNADGVNRNGGRGKSLIYKALEQVQNINVKGGTEFTPGYKHRFADLEASQKVYVLDDVPPNYDYDSFYTNITGETFCEYKGTTGVTIPFEESPKFLFTTNWIIKHDKKGTSTNRRFMEFKFKDYFNESCTPKDIFGHSFFEEWDNDEWNRFYNFVFACVKSFIELGLEAPEYDKETDNYKVSFYNESLTLEFERIFNNMKFKNDGFTVNDFLTEYQMGSLKHEKYFHKNNTKELINQYLNYHKIDYQYVSMDRKWHINLKSN
ncbi:hypothetical protein LB456_09075 [Psychroflexus sp. CAK57W]|uniref:hypothetical protein n=1 Tax=Psychroflexus curvus TaxID=2873595 RepID=UPI001CCBFF77|nr:hypothetical protein [Psychroflexus curvus]MBZ9787606.1 hypothetical protein [Psychroflexus curvus]